MTTFNERPLRFEVTPEAVATIRNNRDSSAMDEHIIADLQYRSQVGEDKYFTVLTTFNGRNALRDAYEEFLDAYVYLTQYLLELEERGEYQKADEANEIYVELLYQIRSLAEMMDRETRPVGFLPSKSNEPLPIPFTENREQIGEYESFVSGLMSEDDE